MGKRLYSIEGKVTRVRDGDTVVVELYVFPNATVSNVPIRLEGIDTKETDSKDPKDKQLALLAKTRVEELTLNKEVVVEFTNKKSYDRYIGKVYLKDNDLSIGDYLLRSGLAEVYSPKTKKVVKAP